MTMTTLKMALLDLLKTTGDPDLRPLIGGGYGIYLKYQQVLEANTRTLLTERPEARSTNDIDIFLRTELLVDGKRLEPLKEALEQIGYVAVEGAEYYQFAKPGPGGGKAGSLKVDLLAGPKDLLKGMGLKADDRRVRTKPKVKGLHAHPVNEAPTLEMGCAELTIQGQLSSGADAQVVVALPHPFTFIMMKLFALRDRVDDKEKDFGRHHALDLYTIFALMSEDEWNECQRMREEFSDNPFVNEAAEITREFFADEDSRGMIRLREHPHCTENLQLADFRQSLEDLVGTGSRV
jgi:hypothetical protein